jgi:hypothetical protein
LQTTENCVAFGRVMGNLSTQGPLKESEHALIKRLLPLIVATIDDRTWRVRWTAAGKFADVILGYDPLPDIMDSLIPVYEKLLQDPKAEVRTQLPLIWRWSPTVVKLWYLYHMLVGNDGLSRSMSDSRGTTCQTCHILDER